MERKNNISTEERAELIKMLTMANEVLTVVPEMPLEDAEWEMDEVEFEALKNLVGEKLYSEANEAWSEGGEEGYDAWVKENITDELKVKVAEAMEETYGNFDSLTAPAMNRVYNIQDAFGTSTTCPAYTHSRDIVNGGRPVFEEVCALYNVAIA